MGDTPGAGWYRDATNPGFMRWWDGAQWTNHVQAAPAPPPPPTAVSTGLSAMGSGSRLGDAVGRTSNSRPFWRRRRVLLPTAFVGLIALAAAVADEPDRASIEASDSVPEVQAFADQSDSEESATGGSGQTTTSSSAIATSTSTTSPPTSSTTVSTTAPPETEAPTTGSTAAQIESTTAPPTTPPATTASTTVPPTTEAPTTTESVRSGVNPGSFCSPVGAKGKTDKGTDMICATTKKNGEPYDQPRWRSP